MTKDDVKKLLESILWGHTSIDDAVQKISDMPVIDAGIAHFDGHRPLRNGFSEVIYGEGKSYEQIKTILSVLIPRGLNILGTRVNEAKGARLVEDFKKVNFDPLSSTFRIIQKPIDKLEGSIAICCAGTSDIPIAEEAFRTIEFFGALPKKYYDVGVAGLHRLLNEATEVKKSDVIIVIAGMEGALPSVVGGMFFQPIIAVPTSVGYGASFKGITALMSMLSSCAEGISVVNIDNGFGAACSALRILNCYTKKNNI